jgi:hypothetical protein
MAKIWYAREGSEPTSGTPRCDLPFEKFKELFQGFKTRYRGTEPPRFPSSKPALDKFRAPHFVILEVGGKELADYSPRQIGFRPQMKAGFYQIDATIDQCEEILKGESL